MPANYLATIRYNIIDKCLRDKYRIWHWNDLAQAISIELQEYHGMGKIPSKRTIMADISAMRSGALGYHAPIVHTKIDGYRYTNPKFTIHQVHIPASLLSELEDTFGVIKEITTKNKLVKLNNAIVKISEYLQISQNEKRNHIIYFEHSLNEPGQVWLDTMYHYIKQKTTVNIYYAPFDAEDIYHIISPVFIKEYNQRWYVFGYHHRMNKIVNLALDRVIDIKPSLQPYFLPESFHHDDYFLNLYGVTIHDGTTPETILFETTPLLSKYMDTKPIHSSQTKISETNEKTTYSLYVYLNYEIKSKLRSFGPDLTVTKPVDFLS